MPFKHEVTDKNGKVHKRVSAERQYAFAVVRHFREHEFTDPNDYRFGQVWPAGNDASWASRRDLADKQAASYFKYDRTEDVEIIACTPVATGKHKGD